jgi:hypothetical protein
MQNEIEKTAPATELEQFTPDTIAVIIDRIPAPDTTDIDRTLNTVEGITIVEDQEDRELIGNYLQDLANGKSRMEGHYEPYAKAAHTLHRAITGLRGDSLKRIAEHDARLRKLALDYDREQARIAAAKAEAARIEREEAARIERERIEAEAQAEADRLAAEGRHDEAEATIEDALDRADQAEQAAAIPIPSAPAPRASYGGATVRENWKFEVVDMAAMVQAAAAPGGGWIMAYLAPDDKSLRSAAKAQKSKLKIPGVRVYDEGSLAVSKK